MTGRAAVRDEVERASRRRRRDSTSSARDVGVGGEPVGHHPRARPRRHPPDALVVGVEDRDAVGGQRLDELALRLLDRLDRPDPRQVDRLDRRHDADLRPADPPPGRRSRRRRTSPSRGPRPVLGRAAGARSAAGRSRCSGCPRSSASAAPRRGRPRSPPSSRSSRSSPVTPTTSGSNRRPPRPRRRPAAPGAGRRPGRSSRRRRRGRRPSGGRATSDRGRARGQRGADERDDRRSARRAGPRTGCPDDLPGVDRAAEDRPGGLGEEAAAGGCDQVPGGQPRDRRCRPRTAGRSRDRSRGPVSHQGRSPAGRREVGRSAGGAPAGGPAG